MGYPGRQNIYNAVIRKLVSQALEQQEQDFREQHSGDTDEALIVYLRQCAAQLGHTPWSGEIVGSTLMEERFGSWEKALYAARLQPPRTAPKPNTFLRVREETSRQQELYRQRKAEQKQYRQERRTSKEKK